jgi:uncharacterized protein (UPF0210 family)
MGISLLDCAAPTIEATAARVRAKIMRQAGRLVAVGREIEAEFGIPIINKRISVTPIALIGGATGADSYVPIAKALDDCAKELEIDFLGGFSALVQKGITPGDRVLIDSIPDALSQTERVCGSVNVGTTKSGINMDAVRILGGTIKSCAEKTRDRDGLACAKFVVFCNAPEDNPFMAGAFHGPGEGDACLNVGVSGPGAVKAAIENMSGAPLNVLAQEIKRCAFKITRMGQLVCEEAARRLGVREGILDLSLAPTAEVGDSVAEALEAMGLEQVGAHGTTAALAMLTDMVKKGGVMAAANVGGLSGAFIPVSEDHAMADAVVSGRLTFDKLEALTSVCSVGLDMIAIPGDTDASTISAIIADEAAIGMVNSKTTAVRVIPVPGKSAGDWAEFGGLLGRAPVMSVGNASAAAFIARGGQIPPPIHSFRN